MSKKEIYHHGYLLVGNSEASLRKVKKMSEEILNLKSETDLTTHPDFYFFRKNFFGINEARKIREMAVKKSFSGKGRIFVIQTSFISKEAGNALLKILEEPPENHHFFIIVPSLEKFLLTLRSRLVLLEMEKKLTQFSVDDLRLGEKFLNLSFRERVGFFRKIGEDREKFVYFLSVLENIFLEVLKKNFSSDYVFALAEIRNIKEMISEPYVSLKLIFDHLALALPKIKNL